MAPTVIIQTIFLKIEGKLSFFLSDTIYLKLLSIFSYFICIFKNAWYMRPPGYRLVCFSVVDTTKMRGKSPVGLSFNKWEKKGVNTTENAW